MDQTLGKKIIALRQRVVANFDSSHWEEVACLQVIRKRSITIRGSFAV